MSRDTEPTAIVTQVIFWTHALDALDVIRTQYNQG